ncbi:MAG: DUF6242 domain-containing protein [Tannerella sp.]|jgi:hypothetical protein|nr:DUF6242 domain-containing protein [Tannerella sp.]
MRKFKTYGWLIGLVSTALYSCLGSNDIETDEWVLKNAQISSFSLLNDSIAGLDSVIFTIDQINGRIFNKDSMRYGTVIDEKVLITMNYEIGTSLFVQIFPQATGDTINWNGTDSIDFSQPVIFKVYAFDGVTTKTYEAKLNVHQVNPDSMVWEKLATIGAGRTFSETKTVVFAGAYCLFARENGTGKMFRSPDANNWTEVTLSGFPDNAVLSSVTEYGGSLFVANDDGIVYSSDNGVDWLATDGTDVETLLGSLSDGIVSGSSVMCGIQNVNNTLRFCAYHRENGWTVGDEVPAGFPVSGFGSVGYEIMYFPHLIVASGRDKSGFFTNKAWSTMDGLTWAPLTNDNLPFAASEGASIVRYDEKLFLLGGFGFGGNALDKAYLSRDNGVTWRDTVFLPADIAVKGFATVLVDDDKYMYLFGGKETGNGNSVNEVWRGRVNRFGFKQDED